MNKAELEKIYLETTYSVFVNNEKYDVRIGETLPAVINKLLLEVAGKSGAILTAWNPRSKTLSSEENKTRNSKLHSYLENNKYINYKSLGQGNDISWQAEESFFVSGVTRETVEQLAVDYEQYAYVWCESEKTTSLVFTSVWQ
jgi:uncharacterized protein DUF3293